MLYSEHLTSVLWQPQIFCASKLAPEECLGNQTSHMQFNATNSFFYQFLPVTNHNQTISQSNTTHHNLACIHTAQCILAGGVESVSVIKPQLARSQVSPLVSGTDFFPKKLTLLKGRPTLLDENEPQRFRQRFGRYVTDSTNLQRQVGRTSRPNIGAKIISDQAKKMR